MPLLQQEIGLFFMSLAVLFSLACGNSADHGEGTSILSPTKRQPAPQVESVCSGYAGVLEEAQAVATGHRSLQEPGIAAQLQTLASTAKQADQPLMERALADLRLPFWLPGVAMSQEGTRSKLESASRQLVRLCVAEGYRSDWYDDPKVIADVFCNPLIGYREQLNPSFPLNRCSGPPMRPSG